MIKSGNFRDCARGPPMIWGSLDSEPAAIVARDLRPVSLISMWCPTGLTLPDSRGVRAIQLLATRGMHGSLDLCQGKETAPQRNRFRHFSLASWWQVVDQAFFQQISAQTLFLVASIRSIVTVPTPPAEIIQLCRPICKPQSLWWY